MKVAKISDVIILYNQSVKNYFEVMLFSGNSKIDSKFIRYEENDLEDGLPRDIEQVAKSLNSIIPHEIKSIGFLVNSEKVFKTTHVYPKIGEGRINSLYKNELKNSYPKYNENYFTFLTKHKGKISNIIYTYFVPNMFKNYFTKLSKIMGKSYRGLDLLSCYLENCLKGQINEDNIYAYVTEEMIYGLVSINNSLAGYFTCLNTAEELEKNIYLYGMKHSYELEKVDFSSIYTNAINIESKVIKFNKLSINLTNSSFTGRIQ